MIPALQNLVLKDFWLKLFSFALAWLIWFTVNIAIKNDVSPVASLSLAPTEHRVLHDLPVVILSSAEEPRGFSVIPKTVDVTVEGDALNLKNLRKQDVRVMVDLTDGNGSRDSRRRIEVTTPAGVAQVKVEPDAVQVVVATKN